MGNKFKTAVITVLIIALALVAGYWAVIKIFPMPYRETVTRYCDEYGVDPALVYAVIKAESNFDPAAVSHAGAKGLAQLTDDTAEYVADMISMEYDSGDSFNAEKNIRISVYYLRYLLDKYKDDLPCAIAAYNAGEGNVDKWIRENGGIDTIPFNETDKYVKKVRVYRKIYGWRLKGTS